MGVSPGTYMEISMANRSIPNADQPFASALEDLAIARGVATHHRTGHVNLRDLWRAIDSPTISEQTLRRLIDGQRAPTKDRMQTIAKAFNVDPSYFVEWRLLEAQDAFDPSVVGFPAAVEAWSRWADANPSRSASGKRASSKSGRR